MTAKQLKIHTQLVTENVTCRLSGIMTPSEIDTERGRNLIRVVIAIALEGRAFLLHRRPSDGVLYCLDVPGSNLLSDIIKELNP